MTRIDCKILAYNLKIKQKYSRSFFSPSLFLWFLQEFKELPYKRGSTHSRLRFVEPYNIAIELPDLPTSLDETTFTKINFFIGKETHEAFPIRDEDGSFDSLNLPKNKNLCFKTHGSFIFKKEDKEWYCVLLLERRKDICIGLSALIKYLESLDQKHTINTDIITTNFNYVKRIKELEELYYTIIKNYNLNFSGKEGFGTLTRKYVEGGFIVRNIQLKLIEGNTPMEKFLNLVKSFFGLKVNTLSEGNIKEFIDQTEVILVGKKPNQQKLAFINLFNDLQIYDIQVEESIKREIDTDDFFLKLWQKVNDKELLELIKLVKQAK